MADKEKKKKERYSVGAVATQTAPVIVDSKTNETTTEVMQVLVKILNNQEKLMKLLD